MPGLFVTINASINGFISMFSIVANSILIVTFARTKSIQNTTNMFLIELSISDLMKATLILPVKVYNQFNDINTFDNSYCQVSGVITTFTTILAVGYLAMIAVVRYYKILKWDVFERVFSLSRGILYSSFIITMVFALALLPVVGVGQYSYSKFHGACFTNWEQHNILFRSMFYVCNIGISFPILIFCYWKIFGFLRIHKKRLFPDQTEKSGEVRMTTMTRTQEDRETTLCPIDVHIVETFASENRQDMLTTAHPNGTLDNLKENTDLAMDIKCSSDVELPTLEEVVNDIDRVRTSKSKEIQHPRKKLKLARQEINITWILFIGVVGYAICWMPATITTILSFSKVIKPSEIHLYAIVTMVEMKLLLNPIIYGVLNSQFRQAVKALICRHVRAQCI